MRITLQNQTELYYKKIGHGLPLLLLHGNGDSHKNLEKLGRALSKKYTVYLIDSRGHGKSSHHDTEFGYHDLANDIHLFIIQLRLQQVSIIGHSDGAIIATILAISKHTYLRSIILLGVTLKPEQMKAKWMRWIQDEYAKNQHPLFKLMIEEPQIEYEELETINIPILVVAAEDDVMEIEEYIEIAQRIALAELYILHNEDHMSYIVETDQFAKKALEFLK